MSYPFEFDISALGDVDPAGVNVLVNSFKCSLIGSPEEPVMVRWAVVNNPLRIQLWVWDSSGAEYDPATLPWNGKRIHIDYIATVAGD